MTQFMQTDILRVFPRKTIEVRKTLPKGLMVIALMTASGSAHYRTHLRVGAI